MNCYINQWDYRIYRSFQVSSFQVWQAYIHLALHLFYSGNRTSLVRVDGRYFSNVALFSSIFTEFTTPLPYPTCDWPVRVRTTERTRFTTFLSIVFPRCGVSWGEVSCSFRRLHLDTPRISRRIKPRLSRDDPAKWSHGGHESISFWKNVAGTNQISYLVLSRYFETLKFATRSFVVTYTERENKIS